MWANSVWGFFGLSVTMGLAVIALPPDLLWLQPYFMVAAILSFVASIAVLCWPLRVANIRSVVRNKLKHPINWVAELIEPTHIIILGLVIAFSGVVWQMRITTSTIPPTKTIPDKPAEDSGAIEWQSGQPTLSFLTNTTEKIIWIEGFEIFARNRTDHPFRRCDAHITPEISGRELTLRISTDEKQYEQNDNAVVLPRHKFVFFLQTASANQNRNVSAGVWSHAF
jgi:hypothetical protein